MFRKFFLVLLISVWGGIVLPLPKRAGAVTPLTNAILQELRNLVQLMPHNKPKRQARKSDAMSPGDGLSTGRDSLADLRFNDGSLARIGEQAVFRFLPKTRNFRLHHGTVLLLIPPKRGQTRINTPNAAAAIRGSALFVRYDPQTDTTIVGALTNSGIKVNNRNASQTQELAAGQLIVIVKDKFKGLYDFDLRTFYNTSDLVRGLDLPLKNGVPSSDPAIASVQSETSDAVKTQQPLTGQEVVENPSFLTTPTSSQNTSTGNNINYNVIKDNSPVGTLLETGQVVSNTDDQLDATGRKGGGRQGNQEQPTAPAPTPPPTTPPVVPQPTTTPATVGSPPTTTPSTVVPPPTTPDSVTPPTTPPPTVVPLPIPSVSPTIPAPVVTPQTPPPPTTPSTVAPPPPTNPAPVVTPPTNPAPVATPPPTIPATVVTPPPTPSVPPTTPAPTVVTPPTPSAPPPTPAPTVVTPPTPSAPPPTPAPTVVTPPTPAVPPTTPPPTVVTPPTPAVPPTTPPQPTQPVDKPTLVPTSLQPTNTLEKPNT